MALPVGVERNNMAENKSADKLSMSMFHTFCVNHFMGREE